MADSVAAPPHVPARAPLLHADGASRRMSRWGAAAGITGPLLLVAYFGIPVLIGWPSAGATQDELIAFAGRHEMLFYLGGWLQVTGALLSVVFFLVVPQLSGMRARLAGAVTIVGTALLLAVVTVEAVFGTPGLVFADVLSVLQAVWIAAAAIALALTAPHRRTQP